MKYLLLFFFLFSLYFSYGQDAIPVAAFDFNQKSFDENQKRISTKPVGVKLVDDRFGNKESALYLEGGPYSYLNLGSSHLLRPKEGSISLWVNIERRVYGGKGYESNPILTTKNSPALDFCDSYYLGYDFTTDRVGASLAVDSTHQIAINTIDKITFNKWEHYVVVFDSTTFLFYLNGVKQGESRKDFAMVYYEPDSVVIGNSASTKNYRFTRGMVDDIRFFNEAISEQDVIALYKESNPNKTKLLLWQGLQLIAVIMLIGLISYGLVYRRRLALKRSQERLDMEYHYHEMEIRTLKAQMNPHFIFNSLNTIQQLILSNENEKAQTYLSKFSKLLRSLLEGNTNDNISLADEVSLLTRYLEMEALRFGNKFVYHITVDESLKGDILMPHMMIQPFVENAIWHGLLPKKNDKIVNISFSPHALESILCVIEDNGVGRSASMQGEQTFKRKSLALSYVRNRLEILENLLKIPCGVDILDKYDEFGNAIGTNVKVIIPIIKKMKP